MSRTKRWMAMAVLAGPTLMATNCATNIRDAAIGGALDYVTGTTTDSLAALIPIVTWLESCGL